MNHYKHYLRVQTEICGGAVEGGPMWALEAPTPPLTVKACGRCGGGGGGEEGHAPGGGG